MANKTNKHSDRRSASVGVATCCPTLIHEPRYLTFSLNVTPPPQPPKVTARVTVIELKDAPIEALKAIVAGQTA